MLKLFCLLFLVLSACTTIRVVDCKDKDSQIYVYPGESLFSVLENDKVGEMQKISSLSADTTLPPYTIINCIIEKHYDGGLNENIDYYKITDGTKQYYVKKTSTNKDHDLIVRKYKSRKNKTPDTLTTTPTTQIDNHDYQTGPRGGKYYINDKGNKVYKKKK